MSDQGITPADDLRFWRWTGLFGKGHITYAPGQLAAEGPFTNPARMTEDMSGEDADFYASVWAHAGWFDKEYAR